MTKICIYPLALVSATIDHVPPGALVCMTMFGNVLVVNINAMKLSKSVVISDVQ